MPRPTEGVGEALALLVDLDRRRNLGPFEATLAFLGAGGVGVAGFGGVADLALWQGVAGFEPGAVIGLAGLLIVPAWIAVFGTTMLILRALGMTDLRTTARARIAALALEGGELLALRDALSFRPWRNRAAFEGAVADLLAALDGADSAEGSAFASRAGFE